jgi:hypothetical protein
MIEKNLQRFGDGEDKANDEHLFLKDEMKSYESMSSIDSYDDKDTVSRKKRMSSMK